MKSFRQIHQSFLFHKYTHIRNRGGPSARHCRRRNQYAARVLSSEVYDFGYSIDLQAGDRISAAYARTARSDSTFRRVNG
jgi:hypothetical protein